jgi:predicted hotdog family 3-hydroxylacyl-ACP dehydratase
MDMRHAPIESFVPHRGAMLLIDRLLAADEECAIVEARVREDGPFVQEDGVPAWVGIEYMAQAIAAWAGARAERRGAPARPGFLLGSRRYEASQSVFPVGAMLRIEARCELRSDNGMGLFDCRIHLDGVLAARAMVSVFEPDDGGAFLQGAGASAPRMLET